MDFDLTVIGGGIVGLATAYEYLKSKPLHRVLVLEKEQDLARHQTGHNSGVLHSGIYYKPGSSKASNCIRGYDLMLKFARAHDIKHDVCGKVIVATEPDEIVRLKLLYERGQQLGLTDLRLLAKEELAEREPNAAGIQALLVPQAGIIDYKAVSAKVAYEIQKRGGTITLGARVVRIESWHGKQRLICADDRNFVTSQLVNCAGLYSDKVAQMTGVAKSTQIIPFRGEYYDLIPSARSLVKHLIYPVPNPDFPFLGVHFTRMIDGGVEAGPNAVLAFRREGYSKFSFNLKEAVEILTWPGFRKFAGKHWKEGVYEYHRSLSKRAFVRSLQKLIPKIQPEQVVPGGSGVRAQACLSTGALQDDFAIEKNSSGIHVLNAPSPAATSSFSIAQHILTYLT